MHRKSIQKMVIKYTAKLPGSLLSPHPKNGRLNTKIKKGENIWKVMFRLVFFKKSRERVLNYTQHQPVQQFSSTFIIPI